jgi:peroxiredoxin
MDALVAGLGMAGIGRAAPRPGDSAPLFELPDAGGRVVRLVERLERGPVVLAFYRGGWCPYCNLQLRAYQDVLPELQRLQAQLLAVSPQLPDGTAETVSKNDLRFDVLSDVGNVVAREYGLVFSVTEAVKAFYLKEKRVDLVAINGDEAWELPVPATFVLDRNGTVALADVDPDYTRRLEPATVLDALRELETR